MEFSQARSGANLAVCWIARSLQPWLWQHIQKKHQQHESPRQETRKNGDVSEVVRRIRRHERDQSGVVPFGHGIEKPKHDGADNGDQYYAGQPKTTYTVCCPEVCRRVQAGSARVRQSDFLSDRVAIRIVHKPIHSMNVGKVRERIALKEIEVLGSQKSIDAERSHQNHILGDPAEKRDVTVPGESNGKSRSSNKEQTTERQNEGKGYFPYFEHAMNAQNENNGQNRSFGPTHAVNQNLPEDTCEEKPTTLEIEPIAHEERIDRTT